MAASDALPRPQPAPLSEAHLSARHAEPSPAPVPQPAAASGSGAASGAAAEQAQALEPPGTADPREPSLRFDLEESDARPPANEGALPASATARRGGVATLGQTKEHASLLTLHPRARGAARALAGARLWEQQRQRWLAARGGVPKSRPRRVVLGCATLPRQLRAHARPAPRCRFAHTRTTCRASAAAAVPWPCARRCSSTQLRPEGHVPANARRSESTYQEAYRTLQPFPQPVPLAVRLAAAAALAPHPPPSPLPTPTNERPSCLRAPQEVVEFLLDAWEEEDEEPLFG